MFTEVVLVLVLVKLAISSNKNLYSFNKQGYNSRMAIYLIIRCTFT